MCLEWSWSHGVLDSQILIATVDHSRLQYLACSLCYQLQKSNSFTTRNVGCHVLCLPTELNAIDGYFLLNQDIASKHKLKQQLTVHFLSLASPTKSKSTNPCRVDSLSLAYWTIMYYILQVLEHMFCSYLVLGSTHYYNKEF